MLTLKFRRRAVGLKGHALLVSASLILLTILLGTRAYFVAQRHLEETRDLLEHDIHALAILEHLESLVNLRDKVQKKFVITKDPDYSALVAYYSESIAERRGALARATGVPKLAMEALAIDSPGAVEEMKHDLEVVRSGKLEKGKEVAQGLLQVIVVALVLSLGITVWLLLLFYRGLLYPLGLLRVATGRIREGDLGHRMSASEGVSEFRELAGSFNTMAERLEALERAKSEFLATVSHEIKNPLAALKEGLNLLASKGDGLSVAGRQKTFTACLIASKRLELMINNLLKLSRGEQSWYDPGVSPGNLTNAIETAMNEVRPMAEKRGMSLVLRAPAALPLLFNWDGIVQVFSNLLNNAIKYGDEKTAIEVSARFADLPLPNGTGLVPHVEVVVENAGRGIAPADMEKIFERFYRGASATHQQGFGIGLHVVKRIVEVHRGGVAAASGQGKTRMRLWLPAEREELI